MGSGSALAGSSLAAFARAASWCRLLCLRSLYTHCLSVACRAARAAFAFHRRRLRSKPVSEGSTYSARVGPKNRCPRCAASRCCSTTASSGQAVPQAAAAAAAARPLGFAAPRDREPALRYHRAAARPLGFAVRRRTHCSPSGYHELRPVVTPRPRRRTPWFKRECLPTAAMGADGAWCWPQACGGWQKGNT